MRKLLWTLLLMTLMTTTWAHAQLATKKALTLEAAKKIAEAASAEAVANKWTMVIVIVDDGGNLIYLQKADGTQIGSLDVAQEKARSAVRFKRPTKAFEDTLVGGRQAILKLPGAMPVEGGVPLMIDGVMLGAIGVSGATSAQDGQVAAAGVKVFEKMAK
ncbi:MAG: heme-binding protein [Bryobacteraceae bacterium]|nr:heme-binding protein [Bryobacteraceae bacterium]